MLAGVSNYRTACITVQGQVKAAKLIEQRMNAKKGLDLEMARRQNEAEQRERAETEREAKEEAKHQRRRREANRDWYLREAIKYVVTFLAGLLIGRYLVPEKPSIQAESSQAMPSERPATIPSSQPRN